MAHVMVVNSPGPGLGAQIPDCLTLVKPEKNDLYIT